MRKIIIFIAIAAVLFTVWFFVFNKNSTGVKYKTAKVERGDIESSISASGTLNAVANILVGSQVSGTIKEIYADFNSKVKKGQVIAVIDDEPFIARARQAEANLESAKAKVENAKANIDNLNAQVLSKKADIERLEANLNDVKKNLERITALWKEGLASQKEMDSSRYNYESILAQLKSIQAAYDSMVAQASASHALYRTAAADARQAEAVLDSSRLDLKHTRITSPVDGIVVSRNIDVGQTVAASFQTPTLFTIAQDLTKMQVNANVDEADIGNIYLGQEARFTVDAYPEEIFKGRVTQIRNAPIIVQNVVTYDCIIEVDNRELKLKPGMTANVSIIAARKNNVLKVPNAALRFRPKDEDVKGMKKAEKTVWVFKNSEIISIPVKTGIRNESSTEIIQGNLKEGDDVILEYVKKKSDYGRSGPIGVPRYLR